jgi:hypothetical protein
VRIGTAIEKPTEFRHLSTWLGDDDLVQLMMRCITVPYIGYQLLEQCGGCQAWLSAHAECRDYATEILGRPDPLDPWRSVTRAEASSLSTIRRPISVQPNQWLVIGFARPGALCILRPLAEAASCARSNNTPRPWRTVQRPAVRS